MAYSALAARAVPYAFKAARVYYTYGNAAKKMYGVAKKGLNRVQAYRNQKAARASAQMANRRRKAGFTGVSNGYYVGKFKRPRKARNTQASKFLTTGIVENREVYGDISDPDCVYLTFSTFDRLLISKTVGLAILKKLFKKCGINIDSAQEEIPITDYNNSVGAEVVVVFKNVSGNTPVSKSITNDTSITSLYEGWPAYKAWFENNNPDGSQLERIYLKGVNGQVLGELNCMQEVLEVYSALQVSIQNRTKSAATTEDTYAMDRVDNQPLVGKQYHFNGGVPKERQMGYSYLSMVGEEGLFLARPGAGLADSYKEPPVAKHFSNVSKVGTIRMNPGQIKTGKLYWKTRGFLNNIIPKWNTPTSATIYTRLPGKSMMFALEEQLNSGSTNKITVSYEMDRKIGARLITAKAHPMKPNYSTATVSNV